MAEARWVNSPAKVFDKTLTHPISYFRGTQCSLPLKMSRFQEENEHCQ